MQPQFFSMSQEPVTPYHSGESKKQQVATMFNNIANRYDTLNQVMSVGIHHKWRKKAVDTFVNLKPEYILDIATGTGDFAIAALRANPKKVTGVDISQGMLDFGKEKIKKANLENKVELSLGDAENLSFPDNTFDVITVGFGVRNFENLELGLSNMLRVLKPGGKVVILEFSKPRGFFSKDNAAYTYLPESVQAFPDFENFTAIMTKVGYKTSKYKALTFGVACIYTATK